MKTRQKQRSNADLTPRQVAAARRELLNCSLCRPHRGENRTRSKRGARKKITLRSHRS